MGEELHQGSPIPGMDRWESGCASSGREGEASFAHARDYVACVKPSPSPLLSLPVHEVRKVGGLLDYIESYFFFIFFNIPSFSI